MGCGEGQAAGRDLSDGGLGGVARDGKRPWGHVRLVLEAFEGISSDVEPLSLLGWRA